MKLCQARHKVPTYKEENMMKNLKNPETLTDTELKALTNEVEANLYADDHNWLVVDVGDERVDRDLAVADYEALLDELDTREGRCA